MGVWRGVGCVISDKKETPFWGREEQSPKQRGIRKSGRGIGCHIKQAWQSRAWGSFSSLFRQADVSQSHRGKMSTGSTDDAQQGCSPSHKLERNPLCYSVAETAEGFVAVAKCILGCSEIHGSQVPATWTKEVSLWCGSRTGSITRGEMVLILVSKGQHYMNELTSALWFYGGHGERTLQLELLSTVSCLSVVNNQHRQILLLMILPRLHCNLRILGL